MAGWESASAWDMIRIYKNIPQAEVERYSFINVINTLCKFAPN